eukprot:9128164-Alexandrium_andersonii.AAC.1
MCIRDRSAAGPGGVPAPVGAGPMTAWPSDAPHIFDLIELRPYSVLGTDLRRAKHAQVPSAEVG